MYSGFCTAFLFLGINGFYALPSRGSTASVYFLLLLESFCIASFFLGNWLLEDLWFCVLPSSS
jgi:hypothetical protein